MHKHPVLRALTSVHCRVWFPAAALDPSSFFSDLYIFLHLSETSVSCYFYSTLRSYSNRLQEAGQPPETAGRADPLLASCFPAKHFVGAVTEIMRVCRHVKKKYITSLKAGSTRVSSHGSAKSEWVRQRPGFPALMSCSSSPQHRVSTPPHAPHAQKLR